MVVVRWKVEVRQFWTVAWIVIWRDGQRPTQCVEQRFLAHGVHPDLGEMRVVGGRHVATHETDSNVQVVNEDPTIVIVAETLCCNAVRCFAKFWFDAKIA